MRTGGNRRMFLRLRPGAESREVSRRPSRDSNVLMFRSDCGSATHGQLVARADAIDPKQAADLPETAAVVLGIRPTVDFAFKKIFGSPENVRALIGLLNAILNPRRPILTVEILNPFS